MKGLLEKRNTIYGICAIWIVLFHTFRKIGMPYIPILTNIIGIGNMAVDIFFFFSGLCLTLSADRHNYSEIGWKGYFGRRLARIIVPYLIICIPYYLWESICESSESMIQKAVDFVADLSSVSFWISGKQTTWYAYGILVFYLLFPWIYRTVKKGRLPAVGMLACFIVFAVISSYIPILNNSMIVWARLPIFTIGIMAAGVDDTKLNFDNKWMLISGVVFLALGSLTSYSELSEGFTIPQVYRLLLYIPMTLSLLILSGKCGRMRLFDMIGTMSFEIYLIHITLFHPLKYYGILDLTGYWMFLIMPVVAVILSGFVRKAALGITGGV